MTSPRFLVIRRDNIGDLVCTTPLIAGIRSKYPGAWIGVVANSYNAPVLEGNADVDEIFAYRKAKHGEITALGAAWERLRLLSRLHGKAVDYAIVATPADRDRGLQIARRVRARHVIAFVDPGARADAVDMPVPLIDVTGVNEVELVWRIARALEIEAPPPPLKVVAPPDELARVEAAVRANGWSAHGPLVAIHVSARKPSQRWPLERFAELMQRLNTQHGARFVLLWAPGDERSPTHPGDDAKAQTLIESTRALPVLAWPTRTLRALIGALAACDAAVLPDGGAMHIAAALGKPLVALFGDSDARRWAPWGVRNEILQAPSRNVADLEVDAVVSAYERLGVASRGPVQ